MPLYNDVLHLQGTNSKFKRCADAMITAALFIGRHQIGDIAHDKKISRFTIEDQRWINARIGAGDYQRARMLPLRQLYKKPPVFIRKISMMKTPITIG